MEYLIGIILALLGGLFYFKNKADKAVSDASIAETKGRDDELKSQQDDVEEEISEVDSAIISIKEERKKRRKEQTPEERAEQWDE